MVLPLRVLHTISYDAGESCASATAITVSRERLLQRVGSSMRRSSLTRGLWRQLEGGFQRGSHAAPAQQPAQRSSGLGAIQFREAAVGKCGQNFRVDVTLATDGRRVAQAPGHGRDGGHQLFLDLALVANRAFTQCLQSFHRGEPGAEVLRRERPPARLAQVFVDVGGIDATALAVLIDPLKQLLARECRRTFARCGQWRDR